MLIWAIMQVDIYLKNQVSPKGILDFEWAKNPVYARNILQKWGTQGRLYAAFSLGIDYLFLIFYSLFFILTTYKLTKTHHVFFKKSAVFVSVLFLLAGILDAFENYYLFQLLTANFHDTYVIKAYYCSVVKFLFITIGIVYLILALITKKFFSAS